METVKHEPVLLKEVLESLHIKNRARYIDATLGAGGYSIGIIGRGGIVLGIDADPKMLEIARENILKACPTSDLDGGKLNILTLGNFTNIQKIAKENGFTEVSGIVFDLGISNIHYLADDRGFSFSDPKAELDMRLNKDTQSVKASDLINTLRSDQLTYLFTPITGIYEAKAITRAIVSRRDSKKIETVGDFLEAVSFLKRTGATHPATKAFLALRIAVNSELENLKETLSESLALLEDGGRLVVVTFHSLEQSIVNGFFKKMAKEGMGKVITTDPIEPSKEEINLNPKSRSALLNVFEKII